MSMVKRNLKSKNRSVTSEEESTTVTGCSNDGIFVKLNDNEFLCTPTGVSKGFMTPEFICKVDRQGNVIQANPGFKPSSEIKMHMRVYEKRPDVGSVVHAHPIYATSFAIAGIPLTQPIMPEAVISLGCVPIAEYGTPSTMEIPDNLEKYLPYFDAVLLENHGALTWSTDLNAAYMKMESVEFTHSFCIRQNFWVVRKNSMKRISRNCMRSVVNLVWPVNILQTSA